MALLDWIFPRSCLKCARQGAYLCFECKKTLLPHPELCPRCHARNADFSLCQRCQLEADWDLDGVVVGFAYQKWLKKLILKLKFYHKKDIGRFLAERLVLLVQMHEKLAWALEDGKLVVTFVPSHRYRKRFQKGYNQSQLLAQFLAQGLGISALQLCKKLSTTRSQLALSRQQRLTNLQGAFHACNMEHLPQGAWVLIVDDVVTTGATLNQLARTIKAHRPDLKVWGLVLARHMGS